MTDQRQHGFTIIELILFLGITGALFASLLFGVNSNINEQRYKDSVAAYASLLQRQYAEVANVRNERDDRWTCTGSQVEQVADGGDARGTSDCVILGRYVQVQDGGAQIETGAIVGSQPASEAELASDVAALIAYAPRRSPVGVETSPLEWQSRLRTPEREATSAGYLILRSPLSGLVRTFATDEPLPSELHTLLTTEAARKVITSCVVADSRISGAQQSVTVTAAVAGPNGVAINRNDERC